MISEPDEQQRNERAALVLSAVASALVNLAVWILTVWLYGIQLHVPLPSPKERVFQVSSTSIRIERRTVPQVAPPQSVPAASSHAVQPQRQAPPKSRIAPPQPKPRPTELARVTTRGTPVPRADRSKKAPASLSEQLAQQEQAFAREAQALNASRAPLSAATEDPHAHAAAEHPFTINVPGMQVARGPGSGILEPLRLWHDHGYNCYYGRYTWTYPGGGTESANIPWPFCYAPERDPLALGIREIPFPLPPPGYRIPPGTELNPIEKEIYERWLMAQR